MTFKQQEKKESYFLSQPHQPFFVLGIVNSILVLLFFALSYKGIIQLTTSSINFHVYSLIYIVFTNLFTGFVFTTYTRFCSVEAIEKKYYKNILLINLAGSSLYILGAFFKFEIMFAAMLTLALGHFLIVLKLRNIYNTSKATNLQDAFWILSAFSFGLVGNILMIISLLIPELSTFAILFSFFLYLIFLTFSIAQRMVPFFSHSQQEKNEKFVKRVFVLFVLKTILGTFNSYEYIKLAEILIDLVLGFYLSWEFIRWKIYKFNTPSILWVLHLGLFWLPAAFFIDAVSLVGEIYLNTSFYFLGIHLIAIGFLTTILIGFGTRVTLGHSAQSPHADTFVTALFWFIQAVVLMRAIYSLSVGFGWGMNFLFDISFSVWLLLFILWGGKFLPTLIYGAKKNSP
ncbi:NnrS family protein [Candidatus Sulfurimonas marisnigri]|uniref:NnrS family protein n=1 Tax=Candidatus Sulfurimonas marisnigri TaxID=2740405 RepID=A0A7S7M0S3_9BACT|nr:NnrS family protein [Candidatus Sulfurimonas marisnigri]QOY54895.1 NnrS family protein [Candidatus Sulfurimonas marisnigri]